MVPNETHPKTYATVASSEHPIMVKNKLSSKVNTSHTVMATVNVEFFVLKIKDHNGLMKDLCFKEFVNEKKKWLLSNKEALQ